MLVTVETHFCGLSVSFSVLERDNFRTTSTFAIKYVRENS